MKKLGIIFGSLAAVLIIGWLGVTFAFSRGVEPWIDSGLKSLNEKFDDELGIGRVDKTSFEQGFLSSTVVTTVTGKEIDTEDELPDELLLKHKIYHGPFAVAPEGMKVCQAYVVTTVDQSNWDDKTVRTVETAFSGKEPIIIKTWRTFGGTEMVEANLAAFAYDEDGSEINHEGSEFTVVGNSSNEEAKGDFSLSTFSIKGEDFNMKLSPSSGTFSVSPEVEIISDIEVGGMEMSFPADDEGPESTSHIRTDKLIISSKSNPLREGSSLMLSKNSLTCASLSYKMDELFYNVNNLQFNSESKVESDNLSGMVRYSAAQVKASSPELGELPLPIPGIDKGVALELGFRGLNVKTAEELVTQFQQLEKESKKSSGKGGDPEVDPEVLIEMSNTLINAIRPGVELYTEVNLGDKAETADIDLSIKLQGDKELLAMKTGREVINAVHTRLQLEAAPELLDNEQVGMYLQQGVQGGMLQQKSLVDRIHGLAEIKSGALSVGGKPFPLPILEMMGPMLDQPIEWDEYLRGMAAGVKAGTEAESEETDSE